MNYKDMLQVMLNKETSDIDLEPLYVAIETLVNTDHWESKNIRLANLVNIDEVVTLLVNNTIGFNTQIQELIGKVAQSMSKNIPYPDMLRNATNVIEVCDGIIYQISYGDTIMINSLYQLESATYDYIDMGKYHPPLVVEPREWTSNSEGGYYCNSVHSMLGSSANKHDGKQALDVLNKLQSIAWELDPLILKLEEEPNKEFNDPNSHEQFVQMAIDSKSTYTKYPNKPFWFIWQFDKRGRQYSKGYHINLQSSGYKKALLNFHRKELIK